jgi:ribosomal-protein-alanine N-acetyltransferase
MTHHQPSATAPRQIAPAIRWMARRDLPQVLDIEQLAFRYPCSEDDFFLWLRARNVIMQVAETGDQVIGFMVYELQSRALVLHNLAVLPALHWRGVGRALVAKLVGKLAPQRRRVLTAQVAEFNLDAQLFFRALGFECSGILRNHFDDPVPIDAFTFVYRASAREEGGQP